jgi:hypothetical protein
MPMAGVIDLVAVYTEEDRRHAAAAIASPGPPPDRPGLKFTAAENRVHFAAAENRMHFTAAENRMHFESQRGNEI